MKDGGEGIGDYRLLMRIKKVTAPNIMNVKQNRY